MKHFFLTSSACLWLVACAPEVTLDTYTPVVDAGKNSAAIFEKDLAACRVVAKNAEAKYIAEGQAAAQNQAIAGALVGAVLIAALGGDTSDVAAGAAYGGLAGAADAGSDSYEIQKYGPRRIVDRCLDQRGYAVLSDLGRG